MGKLGTLRAVRDDELDLMLSWRNHPSIREKMYSRHEISKGEHRSWWERTKVREDLQYLIYEYQGSPRGVVGLTNIDIENSNCCWAFYSDPVAPRGTGSRMEYLALEKVFYEIGLNKLYCEVLDFNKPVIKLHLKFGFQIEGDFRQQHRYNDEYIDIVRLGILKSEWAGRRSEILAKLV